MAEAQTRATEQADTVAAYRSAVLDALGRPIPDDDDLRVWLDDDLIDRAAPEGWVHLITAREVCFALLTGRVVELSLDHDLSDDTRFGRGRQVVDFLEEQQEVHGRSLWPRDGISLHTANPAGRKQMAETIRRRASEHLEVDESIEGGQPRFRFRPRQQ
jgi:hypothetical protein